MLAEVLQDIDQGVPDLARRAEHVGMVSPLPNTPAPPQHAVDRTGHPNGQTLHTAHEPRRRVCLHQQMQMIGLHAVLEEAEGIAGCRAEAALDGREQRVAPKRRQPGPEATSS